MIACCAYEQPASNEVHAGVGREEADTQIQLEFLGQACPCGRAQREWPPVLATVQGCDIKHATCICS